ncbi:hypothetical protein AMECASPLE_036579 [Ameca splendens]|uniref:Uncharacterized protein n=1 Tax=Ameca splendens TaxID=208324 RepID=A0ABV1AG98_9TELE
MFRVRRALSERLRVFVNTGPDLCLGLNTDPFSLLSTAGTGWIGHLYFYTFSTPANPCWVVGGCYWVRGGVHPVQVSGPSQEKTTIHTYLFRETNNLTVMFLDCGRKLEYPEKTHACTGRTCKLRIGTQDLHAARQQC